MFYRWPVMTVHDRSSTWFLAQLKPNSAKIADRNLQRQGFCTFLPLEQTTRRSGSRFVQSEQPVFPGYIFVAFGAEKERWRAINSTNGVSRLVTFGGEPASVPNDIIRQLMRHCDATGKLRRAEQLNPGEAARLTSGPFAEFIAKIETIAPDRRVWVLMDIMGRQTRLAVKAEHLKPVPGARGG